MTRACIALAFLLLALPGQATAQDGPRTGYASVAMGSQYPGGVGGIPLDTRAAGWAVLNRHVHVGGFLGHRVEYSDHGPVVCRWGQGCEGGRDALHTLYLEATGRFGAPVGGSVWLGFELDAGLTVWRRAVSERRGALDTQSLNALVYPAFALVWLPPREPVPVGVDFRLGFEFIGGGMTGRSSGDTGWDGPLGSQGVMAHLGVAFGE